MGDTDKGRNDVLNEESLMLSFNNHRYHIFLFCIISLYFDAIRPISVTAVCVMHFCGLSMA